MHLNLRGGENGNMMPTKVNPNELVEVATESILISQEESLPKLRCTDKKGPQVYNFTGRVFETPYSPKSCNHLCVSEFSYNICNCSFLVGYNITNSECIEHKTSRHCLQSLFKKKPDDRYAFFHFKKLLEPFFVGYTFA